MTRFDTTSYFDVRAPRYQAALRQCPSARVLDLLPYAAAIRSAGLDRQTEVRVCDAFGGTGFLAKALRHSGFSFVICDCSHAMLEGTTHEQQVQCHLTPDDFQSVLQTFGAESFDLVVSHGGLHHVVEAEGQKVSMSASRLRQELIVSRLARLVAPRGLLIIADIPCASPGEIAGEIHCATLSYEHLRSFLGEDSTLLLVQAIDLNKSGEHRFASLRQQIVSRLSQTVAFPVPRWFFDGFVAASPLGHVAAYVDFDQVDNAVRSAGLRSMGRINYCGPWLFRTQEEAGWFFREKFSVGRAAGLGSDPDSERSMYGNLRQFLGARELPGLVAVNWGVTYAIYSWCERP